MLLSDRCVRGNLIQTFKIVNQIDDIPVDTFFKFASNEHGHATRNAANINMEGDIPYSVSNLNFAKPQAGGDIRRNFFSHRVVDTWNSLPDCVKLAKDVNNFKNLYDSNLSEFGQNS